MDARITNSAVQRVELGIELLSLSQESILIYYYHSDFTVVVLTEGCRFACGA